MIIKLGTMIWRIEKDIIEVAIYIDNDLKFITLPGCMWWELSDQVYQADQVNIIMKARPSIKKAKAFHIINNAFEKAIPVIADICGDKEYYINGLSLKYNEYWALWVATCKQTGEYYESKEFMEVADFAMKL